MSFISPTNKVEEGNISNRFVVPKTCVITPSSVNKSRLRKICDHGQRMISILDLLEPTLNCECNEPHSVLLRPFQVYLEKYQNNDL
mmetsp:Transcript_39806/g.96083  ORF Transcript_39806/g.96083 Transcript_39806/m.96083 type:complete len:86 (-) Transcript_39806:1156-1413(-)